MSKIWGISSLYKWGAPKPRFGRLCNWTATLTAYILGTKHDIDNRSSALTTTRGLLHRPKISWTSVHKRLQTGPQFYPLYVNSALYVIARLRRRRSANRSQPNFAKRRMVNRANKLQLGSSPRKKLWPRNFYICSVFRRLRHLMANIF